MTPGRRFYCKGCGGHAEAPVPVPVGWYSISVRVPAGADGRDHKWVGMFCSVRCLSAYLPVMEAEEARLRVLFAAVVPAR